MVAVVVLNISVAWPYCVWLAGSLNIEMLFLIYTRTELLNQFEMIIELVLQTINHLHDSYSIFERQKMTINQ